MFENLTKLRNEQPAAFWALVVLVVVVIAGGLWSRSAISNANAQRIAAEQGKRGAEAAAKKALSEKGATETAAALVALGRSLVAAGPRRRSSQVRQGRRTATLLGWRRHR